MAKMMVEAFLDQLRALAKKEDSSPEDLQQFARSPLLSAHEVAQATYALLAYRLNRPPVTLDFKQLASGAIPLLGKSFFPWGALPYPKEHAELALLLAQLPHKREQALKMLSYQEATVDHRGKAIPSFLTQRSPSNLQTTTESLFQTLGHTTEKSYHFVDEELGIVTRRGGDHTIVSFGSGCKSGMGVFLYKDTGVINYGPGLPPIGECAGFGLAGRARHFFHREGKIGYQTRLAAPHSRETGIDHLSDSGYSGVWVETETEISDTSQLLQCTFEGSRLSQSPTMVFFGKARACFVAKSHKLNPRSLDRYHGPAQTVSFEGEGGRVVVAPVCGASHLEVIPLAGDESYWGADFLAAFTVSAAHISLHLSADDATVGFEKKREAI